MLTTGAIAMTNLEKAQQYIEQKKPHWIEPHAIAVQFGLPMAQAKEFLQTPGYRIKQKMYHRYCCEPPVALFDAPVLSDGWECPECQEEVGEDEIYFEPVAVREGDRTPTDR